ncbi:FxSxx-COOH system tetratricopeptide repeat protein [Amycolatopsis sp. WQ 127309]|uniref:FxSxx-COOH system tetratricopeptide repeat protein n=1 Tax=Amycolatopsis sp. WQ 127309 TaxID=2932773 RepID=UPI001FF217D3|nr:FxSxx-COOH system tetratricopeptide repeat protein [Amycolatopsis sp. WQ 127309]UOZ07549.1 FxSxx-COOH system tetratricopeptide repeat protein [Amycolatopsis sp. WQ 127309]
MPTVSELSWSEVGDAVWLAMAIGDSAPRVHPEFESPEEPADPEDLDHGSPEPPEEPAGPTIPPLGRGPELLVTALAKSAEILGASGAEGVNGPSRFLPEAAAVTRALRPLKQTRPSRREQDVVLDEDLTAEQAAQDRLWLPQTKPATLRALDLTVVVDSSPSMALWQPTVAAFLALLRQLGAFRAIQIRLVETDKRTGDVVSGPVLRGGTPGAPERQPAELLDPSGHRLMLVLTDGMGESWREDLVSPLLAQWGRTMPVCIVQVLPQRLWGRSGPQFHQARLTTPGPFRPNRRYGLELPDSWLTGEDPGTAGAGAVPIPVVELDARWLSWWVRLVSRVQPDPVQAVVMLARTQPQPAEPWDELHGPELSAGDRVRHFHGIASPSAFRLATLLAAVPVSLPIARFVQSELVPEAATADLAEVFSSGLLDVPPATETVKNWDDIVYEFPSPVREALLAAGRRSDTARVVVTTTRRFGDRYPVLLRVAEALDDPVRAPLPESHADLVAGVAIERAVMRTLSGPYAGRADRLLRWEAELAGTSGTATESGTVTNPLSTTENLVADVHDQAADSLQRVRQFTTDAPTVWGAVPARNPDFTGRQLVLEELAEELHGSGRAVLFGTGGLGKTQIAAEYVYQNLGRYDLVWWVSAAQGTQIRASLTELARQLGLAGAAETVTAVPAVLEALRSGQPYRRWLLVFDSADEPEAALPFLPSEGPGEIVVTTRNPDWPENFPQLLEVRPFTRSESTELLSLHDPQLGAEQADRLAAQLGDLPLALAQAASLRTEIAMPVDEYLRRLEEKTTEILATSAPTEYEVPIAAAWNVSFDELGTRNRAAHQLLQVCAFFAPEPISRSIFTGVRRLSIAPELDAAMRDPTQLDQALRDINRWGLAKVDHRSDTLQLHWLVQLVLRNRMSDQHRRDLQHGAHLLLANRDPGDPAAARLWPQYHTLLPHIYAAELIDCDDDWVRELVINLLKFLYFWGDHTGATLLAQRVTASWTERFGEADPLTLEASERLGFFLWVLGRYEEAEVINNRTLRLYQQKETAGQRSEQTLNAQLSVAVVLKARGDFVGARRLNLATFHEAVAILGSDEPKTLTAAHDLVVSLLLTGEYEEARRIGEDTYARCAEILGPDNAATISTLNILAICRREIGDYALARMELQKIVERVRNLFRDDNAGVVRREYHLAVALRKDGQHAAALTLSRSTLERFRSRYGLSHPNTLPCALAHSIDLRYAGELEAAGELGRQAVDLYRASLGDRHPHTLISEIDLGVTLRLLGQTTAARKQDDNAFRNLRRILGADHPHTIAAAIDLANDQVTPGSSRMSAERLLVRDTESLARARRTVGEDHPITLAAQLNRALDLRGVGRDRESVLQQQDVVARYRRVLRGDHPMTVAAERGKRAVCDIDPTPL